MAEEEERWNGVMGVDGGTRECGANALAGVAGLAGESLAGESAVAMAVAVGVAVDGRRGVWGAGAGATTSADVGDVGELNLALEATGENAYPSSTLTCAK